MVNRIIVSDSERKTKKIAFDLVNNFQGQLSKKCLIFALEGDLGAGKTVFAKGVAEALGIKKIVRSPSFIIQREFPYEFGKVKGKFYHMDLWRMESEAEVEKLKIKELIKSGNVILIEWAEKTVWMLEKLKNNQQAVLLSIKISHLKNTSRKIEIKTEIG